MASASTATETHQAQTNLTGAHSQRTSSMPPLYTSFPSHPPHDTQSDVSALDEIQSAAPGSPVSTQDEDANSTLAIQDRRVPSNQQTGAGPSPLRQSELGEQDTGLVGANGNEMALNEKAPATFYQEPRPQVMASTQRGPMAESHYPVPPGEDPDAFVVPLEHLKEWSAPIDCPACHQRVMTRTTKESGDTVTIWAVVLCCLTGVLCFWIPCVMDDCKDTHHRCGNCDLFVAEVSNGGRVTVRVPPVSVRSQYAAQPPTEQIKELDSRDTKAFRAEAASAPLSELPQSKTVRDVGGAPQEIGVI